MKTNKLADHIKFISERWLSRYPFKALSKAVLSLQRGLTGERTLITKAYMDNPEYVAAYLAYYWPVSYTQIQHSLNEAHESGCKPVPEQAHKLTILDFGSGPAPMSTAFMDFLVQHYAVVTHVTVYLADISHTAMDIGETILTNASYPFSLTIYKIRTDSLSAILDSQIHFDCIIFGHSLNELISKQTTPFDEINRLLSKNLTGAGTALFIEPALLATSRNLIALRNVLLEKQTISYALPCPNTVRCSVLDAGPSHTCHDEFRWEMPAIVARLANANGLDRETIKMTWFMMFRQTLSYKNATYTVVSEPLLNKAGRIRYIVCGASGRIALSASKNDIYAKEIGFFSLKRGDIIQIENPQTRESGYGITAETKILLVKQH